MNEDVFPIAGLGIFQYHVTGSTISTLLHDKINPKKFLVLSLGDTGFLQFFRVVSRDYGKPRVSFLRSVTFHCQHHRIYGNYTPAGRWRIPLPHPCYNRSGAKSKSARRTIRCGRWWWKKWQVWGDGLEIRKVNSQNKTNKWMHLFWHEWFLQKKG